jgi:hypothetical protein
MTSLLCIAALAAASLLVAAPLATQDPTPDASSGYCDPCPAGCCPGACVCTPEGCLCDCCDDCCDDCCKDCRCGPRSEDD